MISVGIRIVSPVMMTRKVPGGMSEDVMDAAIMVKSWTNRAHEPTLRQYRKNSIVSLDSLGTIGILAFCSFASSFDKPAFVNFNIAKASLLDLM